MMRFGPRIEPITSQTPGGCAISYATDAGLEYIDYSMNVTSIGQVLNFLSMYRQLETPKKFLNGSLHRTLLHNFNYFQNEVFLQLGAARTSV